MVLKSLKFSLSLLAGAASVGSLFAVSWVGLALLVGGFTFQAIVYYTAHGNASVVGVREDSIGLAAMATTFAAAASIYATWVPRHADRLWAQTWRIGSDGNSLEGEALAQAERALGAGWRMGSLGFRSMITTMPG